MLKVYNKNTRTTFYCVSLHFLVFLLLFLNKQVFAGFYPINL